MSWVLSFGSNEKDVSEIRQGKLGTIDAFAEDSNESRKKLMLFLKVDEIFRSRTDLK